jgi:RNA polymerase sigma-70 factor (ECF subfamily)
VGAAVVSRSEFIDPAFLESLRREMIAFARMQLRDAALAEDAVQEALAAALDGADRFSGASAMKTWVFGILRNKIVDGIRQQARSTPASAFVAADEGLDQAFELLFKENAHWHPAVRPGTWGDPEESLREKGFWAVFETCLEHLPANTARVFMMREVMELDTAEICAELGISAGNCHVILHRARAALRGCLEQGWFAGEKPC